MPLTTEVKKATDKINEVTEKTVLWYHNYKTYLVAAVIAFGVAYVIF